MPNETRKNPIKIIVASAIILATVAYLAFTGGRDNKSYYVTIGELQGMGDKAYVRHLRVAGNVAPGSIHRAGANATFDLLEQGRKLTVVYQGSEPPPDTFKDDAQALAVGTYGHDGVFHATELQAKCASKYAPAASASTTAAAALPAPPPTSYFPVTPSDRDSQTPRRYRKTRRQSARPCHGRAHRLHRSPSPKIHNSASPLPS